MRTGHEWRSLIESGDYQPSRTRFSRGVVLTSSSILLLIAALIFWPILQFTVSSVSADNSIPILPIQSTTTPIPSSPTPSPTLSPTATSVATENSPTQQFPPTEIPAIPMQEASTPLQTGLVVLALNEADHSHLFAYQSSNSPFTRLTSGPWDDITPDLSPDGRWLAFSSNRSGSWDLYLLDLHSGELTRLTDTSQYEAYPSWSPDGNLIAYESYDLDYEVIIRSVFDDMTLINLSEHPAADYQPTWSPQGRQLVFISNRSGESEVWLADFDKYGEERFTNLSLNPGMEESHPIWSPDGTSLAWAAGNNRSHSVYIWNPTQGSRYIGSGDWPIWSPDSSILLTTLDDANQTLMTAYQSTDGRLELPPVVLPGLTNGLTWGDHSLPSPLPQNLQQISLEPPEMSWPSSASKNSDSQDGRDHLAQLSAVQAPYPQLHDSVDEAFQALRAKVSTEAGWDFLGSLENAFVPLTAPLPPGMGDDWLYTGRAFAFDTVPMNAGWVIVVPEYYGHQIYWRVFIKARFQNGSLGKPIHHVPWNFNARFEGDPLYYEQGGQTAGVVPAGYWIDFTEMAIDLGWQRLPALPTWQSAFFAARFNEFVITNDQSWLEAMQDLYPLDVLVTPTPVFPPTLTPTRTPSWPVVATPGP